ncbi:hypothetical protein SELMODRAFT_406128 [Selaginella moellendorffii]|uniref:Uncharacterized protein n=1 Tax=Selaginella moellendorffii TaxID=88036 RepID=D8R1D0_SELML|nr:hypothetical protein SELMODRAFT_406128 [Selaginella moellendorffii]
MRAAARKAVVPKTRKKEAEERKAEKISRELESLRERVLRKEAELSNLSKRKVGNKYWDDLPNKRAKYLGNPFQAEVSVSVSMKSSYDRRLLEINNPFVDIKVVPERRYMPPDNVSDGKLMDEAAFKAAVGNLLEPVAGTSQQFKAMGTELGAKIVYASILQNIRLLTSPSLEADSEVVVGGKEQLQLEDLQLVEQEGDDIRHEGDEGKERGNVRDPLLDPANNLVTVIIIECDWKGTTTKLDQGAGYAIRAAKLNMKKGRYEPIYVHHWYKGGWNYGVLRPKGIVTVKDGTILNVHTAIQDKEKVSLEDLESRLRDFTRILSEQYFHLNQFPDDEYVLGSLHFCATEMTLPASPDKPINKGGLLFFTSLIRTFIGDRALTLTSADIEDNHAKWKASIQQTIEYFLSSLSATYSRMPSTAPANSRMMLGVCKVRMYVGRVGKAGQVVNIGVSLPSLWKRSTQYSCWILDLTRIYGFTYENALSKCPWLNAFLKRIYKRAHKEITRELPHASRRTRSPKSVLAIQDERSIEISPKLAGSATLAMQLQPHFFSTWDLNADA